MDGGLTIQRCIEIADGKPGDKEKLEGERIGT